METQPTGSTQPQLFAPYGMSAKTVVAVAGRVLSGTGTVYSSDRVDDWAALLQPRVSFVIRAHNDRSTSVPNLRPDIRTAAQHMAHLRDVLNPPMSVLSTFFGLSRQALYKWIAGSSEPEPENLRRIQVLSQVADSFVKAKVGRPDTLLLMKTFQGRSLLDLIQAGESTPDHVQALIQEARLQDAAYQRSGVASSRAPATDDWRSNVSIPGGSEPGQDGGQCMLGRETNWRQGSLLKREAALTLGLIGDADEDRHAVVITHDCDLTSDHENEVEVIVATAVARLDGQFANARHPGKLHLEYHSSQGEPVVLALGHGGKHSVIKQDFVTLGREAQSDYVLDGNAARVLKQ